jgi:3,4-dihydroxy-9,10-secoandrosta-1,3,5(10)-triene-9,17-dione 4,5-dioxygenase
MDTSPVFGLGYVRIWEADLPQWQQFAEDALGMMSERDGDSRLLVRMDDWVGRFIVEEGRASFAPGSGSLVPNVAIGWECTSEEAWASARRAIDDSGVHTEDGNGPTAWCRDWFACTDPSGFRCEFFYGGKRDPASQFVSPRGVSFVTGEQGMGHVLLFASACAKSLDFYSRALGFQVREAKSADDGTLRTVFLSPNQREHSLALLSTEEASRVGHVLIEVSDLDAVGRAMDRCMDGLALMTVSLGRHWNDQMISFYLRTPSGFDIEYGFGGRRVAAERWSRGEQGGTGLSSTWGHRRIGPDGRPGLQLGR